MNCPYCIKKCSKCSKLLVANSINFNKQKGGKYGLMNRCKECRKIESKEWRENNKERKKEYNKEYYENNKERKKEYDKEYYENNKEHIKEYYKEYYENNPDKVFNYANKRRSIEENQGRGISKDQWYEMMEFFDWKCAYSGEYIGGKENRCIRSIDHIIPLSKGGENEIWNCIPMHRSYNSSKFTNDMLEWYQQQEFYSEERLNKIYEWIEYAKNKWENSNK